MYQTPAGDEAGTAAGRRGEAGGGGGVEVGAAAGHRGEAEGRGLEAERSGGSPHPRHQGTQRHG